MEWALSLPTMKLIIRNWLFLFQSRFSSYEIRKLASKLDLNERQLITGFSEHHYSHITPVFPAILEIGNYPNIEPNQVDLY